MNLLQYSQGTFQTAASALDSGASESTCSPIRSVSQFITALWVLWTQTLMVFQSQMFWGLVSGAGFKSWDV